MVHCRNVCMSNTLSLQMDVLDCEYTNLLNHYNDAYDMGYRFYCVDSNRGMCYYTAKEISIPIWALKHKDKEYKFYYLAHELAHAFTMSGHDSKFMKCFREICPEHLQHYEIGYKAKQAILSGIVAADF